MITLIVVIVVVLAACFFHRLIFLDNKIDQTRSIQLNKIREHIGARPFNFYLTIHEVQMVKKPTLEYHVRQLIPKEKLGRIQKYPRHLQPLNVYIEGTCIAPAKYGNYRVTGTVAIGEVVWNMKLSSTNLDELASMNLPMLY